VIVGLAVAAGFAGELEREERVPRGMRLADRKEDAGAAEVYGDADADADAHAHADADADAEADTPLLATLVQTHSEERVPLDAVTPAQGRFDTLLADRVTGTAHALDPRLLALLRAVAKRFASDAGEAPRIELVSGFRSPKLNEMMRKKGHHVASHSQHSLGNAVDFRVVIRGGDGGVEAVDPRDVEAAVRAEGWDGGVGTYTLKDDWFTHADVGPRRDWREGPNVARGGMGRGE
jgi:uncharacterized protein YcbK (DUF882 family)